MGFLSKMLGKDDEYNPRKNVDWDVYEQDFFNGMSWKEQEDKIASGGYAKGLAEPSDKHGRIDDEEYYDRFKDVMGEKAADTARQLGWFMED